MFWTLAGISENELFVSRQLFENLNIYLFVLATFIESLASISEDTLEYGIGFAVVNLLKTFVRLGPVFYTFLIGTQAFYFERTLSHGGAK